MLVYPVIKRYNSLPMSADTNPGSGRELSEIKSNVAGSVEASFVENPEMFVVNAGAFMHLSKNDGLLKQMLAFQSLGIGDLLTSWRGRGFAFGYVYHDRVAKGMGQTIEVIADKTIGEIIDEWNAQAAHEREVSDLFTDEQMEALRFRRAQKMVAEMDPELTGAIGGVFQSPPLQRLEQPLRQSFIEGGLLITRMIRRQREKLNPPKP
jgi:hypothetical protein